MRLRGYKRPPFSEEWKKKIGDGNRGKIISEEVKEKISKNNARYWLGKKRSPDTVEKIRKANIGKVQEQAANWKGGITPINKKLRNSMEYIAWREAVFKRDDYTCQECGKKGVYLEAHHIRPFSLYPDLRFDVLNGLTLCKDCHQETKGKEERLFRYEFVQLKEDLIKQIDECEGKHTQQAVYSTFHSGITQVCFGCMKIRSTIKR